MTLYNTILDYNNYLVTNKLNINIIEYVKEVNKLKYNEKKKAKVFLLFNDINFIDEFVELVKMNVLFIMICFKNMVFLH
jgi:hypothetical protein